MGKGTVVHKESILYKDNAKAKIVVIEYDDSMYYATEFVELPGGKRGDKTRIYKGHSMSSALRFCKDRFDQQIKNGWAPNDPVFGAIEQQQVSKFLEKWDK